MTLFFNVFLHKAFKWKSSGDLGDCDMIYSTYSIQSLTVCLTAISIISGAKDSYYHKLE
jgi:hypothetical protein